MNNKDNLKLLSASLAKVHKSLMEHEMEKYQKRTNQPLTPGTKLNLLLQDPEFAWLRVMSQLMVKVDDVIFQKEPITDESVHQLKTLTEDLMVHEVDEIFSKHFASIFNEIPDLKKEYDNLKSLCKPLI